MTMADFLSPVVMEIKADTTDFHKKIAGAKAAAAAILPSDYEIRLDALKLIFPSCNLEIDTPALLAEWLGFIEDYLRNGDEARLP
jgi:hypothetical protein